MTQRSVYAGATVAVHEVDRDGNETGVLKPLYMDLFDDQQAPNPFKLDQNGRLPYPIYLSGSYRLRITKPRLGIDHATGVLRQTAGGDGSAAGIPILFKEDLGMAGDGGPDGSGTDDSFRFNKACADWSAKGGAIFILTPQPGKGFKFAAPGRIRDGITVILTGGPFFFTKKGRMRIQGDFATFPETNLYRLGADATAGQDTIKVDTTPQGGGLLSAHFNVGDKIIIRGMTDAALNSLERDELEILSINDLAQTLRFTTPISYSYKITYDNPEYFANTGVVDRTLITKVVSAKLPSDLAAGSDIITLAPGDVAKFSVGALVLIEDEKKSADQVSGGSNNPIHKFIAEVTAINEDGPNTLRINARTPFAFETAYSARVTLMKPARFASLQGGTAIYTEAPDAAPAERMHSFEIARAAWCFMSNLAVPNEDDFGTRGNMFRMFYSYGCGFDNVRGRNPKHLGSGDGYGLSFYYSTNCWARTVDVSGNRHGVLFQNSVSCSAWDVAVADDRGSAVDFHGLSETECWVHLRSITGGSLSAFSSNTAVKFGNTAHRVGPFRCGVTGGQISRYYGTGRRVVQFVPGAVDCYFGRSVCDDVQCLLYHEDIAAAATLLAQKNRIDDVVVRKWRGRLIDCNGTKSGSGSTKTLKNTRISGLRAYSGTLCVRLIDCDGFELLDYEIADIVGDPPAAEIDRYGIAATRVDGLIVSRGRLRGMGRGLSLEDCPAYRVTRNEIWDLYEGIVRRRAGLCSNGRWRWNDFAGFSPVTVIEDSPTITGATDYPLPITDGHDFITTE